MRVLLVATGSRGDVEPFVALGLGLARAGNEPLLAASRSAAARAVAARVRDEDGVSAAVARIERRVAVG